nr:MAG TPA: hypothetical protein [Caudoviricetes sp.]
MFKYVIHKLSTFHKNAVLRKNVLKMIDNYTTE